MAKPSRTEATLPGAVTEAIVGLGRAIRIARLRRRWTQADLARRAGVSPAVVGFVEHGRPGTSLAHVASLLWALGFLSQLEAVAAPDADAEGLTLEAARLPVIVRPARSSAADF